MLSPWCENHPSSAQFPTANPNRCHLVLLICLKKQAKGHCCDTDALRVKDYYSSLSEIPASCTQATEKIILCRSCISYTGSLEGREWPRRVLIPDRAVCMKDFKNTPPPAKAAPSPREPVSTAKAARGPLSTNPQELLPAATGDGGWGTLRHRPGTGWIAFPLLRKSRARITAAWLPSSKVLFRKTRGGG